MVDHIGRLGKRHYQQRIATPNPYTCTDLNLALLLNEPTIKKQCSALTESKLTSFV